MLERRNNAPPIPEELLYEKKAFFGAANKVAHKTGHSLPNK
jgi:hypothetical protein